MGDFLAVAETYGRLPGRGPGAKVFLAEACQLVLTHFLSWASKKENALQKKEDAQGKPQGFPCESFPKQRGRGPSDSSGVLDWKRR